MMKMTKKNRNLAFALVMILAVLLIMPTFVAMANSYDSGSKFLASIDSPMVGSIAISTKEQLKAIKFNPSGTYHLISDIDLSGVEWEPIGDASSIFKGTFDGQGHVIRNLTITGNHKYNGLFGYADKATIKNVGLENTNIDITSSSDSIYSGGICGYIIGSSTISNCYNTGIVSAASTSTPMFSIPASVGGICGHAGMFSTISNCYNMGSVSIISYRGITYASGIGGSGTISNCYNTGTISSTSTSDSSAYASGIGGGHTISNCYNMGTISATSMYLAYARGIGGDIAIRNCYNTGTVSATNTAIHILGANTASVAGISEYSSATISNCYWNIDSTQKVNGNELANADKKGSTGLTDKTTPLNTAQMKNSSNFIGFDFDNIWDISPDKNQGYPFLRASIDEVSLPSNDPLSLLFEKKSSEYNQSLAVASARLSEAAYNNKKVKIKDELISVGFDKDILTYNHDKEKPNGYPDTVAYAFAHKKILVNGEQYTVFVVAIRGTPLTTEWISNFKALTSNGTHKGFNTAKNNLNKDLNNYIQRYKGGTNNKILFTGHSRGGAVANLLAAQYTKDTGFKKDDIYAYTFASPNVTINKEANNIPAFNNILNFVYTDDLVPYVPPAMLKLGYIKYGTTYALQNKTSNPSAIHAHAMTRYLKKIRTVKSVKNLQTIHNFIYNMVACPVNVEVYNGEGKLVGRVIKNKVDKKFKSNVIMFVEGDVKHIYMPTNDTYTIKLTGTAKGKMSYTLSNVDITSSKITKQNEFKNVTLTKGKIIISEIEKPKINRLFVIKKGKVIAEVTKKGKEIPKIQLSAPKRLNLTTKKLTWKTVANNNGYILKVSKSGTTIKTVQIKKGETNWKVPKKLFKKGNKYRVTLVVKGKGKYVNSKSIKSKVVKIKK